MQVFADGDAMERVAFSLGIAASKLAGHNWKPQMRTSFQRWLGPIPGELLSPTLLNPSNFAREQNW